MQLFILVSLIPDKLSYLIIFLAFQPLRKALYCITLCTASADAKELGFKRRRGDLCEDMQSRLFMDFDDERHLHTPWERILESTDTDISALKKSFKLELQSTKMEAYQNEITKTFFRSEGKH